jgi:uncharacterized repeat protein (TIGR01451 family)
MATDDTGQPRRPIDPLVGVVKDSVALGYEAVELVVEGLRESMRLQTDAVRGSVRDAARPAAERRGQPARPAVPPALVGDVAALAAELFRRAGAVADQVAKSSATHAAPGSDPDGIPELPAQVVAGESVTLEFSIWNTGPTALRNVTPNATDLLGAGTTCPRDGIVFAPPIVAHIGPGKAATVQITASVPAKTPAGTYRALIQSEPGDKCAVLELTVTAAPTAAPRRRRTP